MIIEIIKVLKKAENMACSIDAAEHTAFVWTFLTQTADPCWCSPIADSFLTE
jgi:hypothetical protein